MEVLAEPAAGRALRILGAVGRTPLHRRWQPPRGQQILQRQARRAPPRYLRHHHRRTGPCGRRAAIGPRPALRGSLRRIAGPGSTHHRRLRRHQDPRRPGGLRRPHRPHRRAAEEQRRRLGEIQTRWRHRPSAARRGAGHVRRAMGSHQRAGRRFLHRGERADGGPRRWPRTHHFRGRRHQAVDLFFPGRQA